MRRVLLTTVAGLLLLVPSAYGDHTAGPASVVIAGSLQSELGCPGDWQPDCAASGLAYDTDDGVWQGTFSVPAGTWEYKVALNGSWDENYGQGASPGGANVGLSLAGPAAVKFYYDHATHWVTSSRNAVVATVPGSFQSELGCPGDWQPDCLRSWLQDPDGDGTYAFATDEIPPGAYEAKVAHDEAWDVNYGAGGVQNGANIGFSVGAGDTVAFTYVAATHVLTITTEAPPPTGDVEWAGLRHDSRDALYRAPGGAVPAGTPVKLRFRTFHDDVTGVAVRLYDVDANGQRILPMARVASDVSCYEDLGGRSCDFWQVELSNAEPNNYWYRFIVSDGPDTDYYADDTAALDGGPGAATDEAVDRSYALTVYEPGFAVPAWAPSAVVYQIFPDRFANGDRANDPRTGDVRYDDPVLALPWGTLPEGYCRDYADADGTTCPWRFDATPPDWSPEKEGPRGRDYFGGDLKGIRQRLDHLAALGVTAIYLNPIFDARSNHRYDTADYTRIDPALGDLKEFEKLVKQARERGIRVLLDGVFNHLSSDSPLFDRYGHHDATGACESLASPWRSWFVFRNDHVPCDGDDYEGWFGFDSIPVLEKTNPAVQDYFLEGPGGITRLWLDRGAAGWRLDVSGDPSFPNGYWERFRDAVRGADPDALTISETWGKDTTLLRMLRGDRLDTTMNYRFRDAAIGLVAPGRFDAKGLGDGGRVLAPSEFASRLESIYEDYAPAAASALLNLLDSHDTERALWTLTPGPETRAAREGTAANVAEGKRRLRLAGLVQFTVPGMPTVYYGDEAGVTGDDDPDDRRTFPWPGTGGRMDAALVAHYAALSALRREVPALVTGDLEVIHADDAAETVAYVRGTPTQAAVVAINRSGVERAVALPSRYAGEVVLRTRPGAELTGAQLTLPPLGGAVVLAAGDFAGPAAPGGLAAVEGAGSVELTWSPVAGAASYAVYRSPVSEGGYVRVGTTSGTSFVDTGLRNGRPLFYVVRALDAAGNESGDSNEVEALPHLTIGWANLQWPPSIVHTISATTRTATVYGQVWIDGATAAAGPTEGLRAALGWGPDGSSPAGNPDWTWEEAGFNVDAGNNDEFRASLLPDAVGRFDYAYRYSTTGGRDWVYADIDGIGNGYAPAQAGDLLVVASGDTTAPPTPSGLRVVSGSPAGIELAWDAVADPTLHGYEVRRSASASGPYATLALVAGPSYTDTDVVEGATYRYVVRAVDESFNRSGDSAEVSGTAALRTVSVTFDVTVPGTTDATGRAVHLAGFLNRLDGGLPEWDPGGVALTRVDATRWTITLTGREATQLEYKYALGSWDYVEKDASCGEIANRQLTLAYGTTGSQIVTDSVPNWRNVAPCGN